MVDAAGQGRGPVATILVQSGTLNRGDIVIMWLNMDVYVRCEIKEW